MANHTMHRTRTATLRIGIARWMARRRMAFEVLHPQVEIAKRSTTVKVVTGTAIATSIVTGQFNLAVALAAAWLGSKPLTHVVAGGVASVGTVDATLQAAIARLLAMQDGTAEATAPSAGAGAA
jgi:hypothetical protein